MESTLVQCETPRLTWNFARMKTLRLATLLMLFLCQESTVGLVHAGFISSTVNQDGTKRLDYNMGLGSASKIGIFDFGFGANPSPESLIFIKARIRLWVQLPPDAIGDLAPEIVFAKAGTTDLNQALITGDAVKTDIRISFNLFPSGNGVVEKTTGFENLTSQQSLALSSIIAKDPSSRVEAWLVSDTLKAITVPAFGEFLDFSNGFPIVTVKRFTATLDLVAPEPSSNIIFAGFGLLCVRRFWTARKKWTSNRYKEIAGLCPT